MKLSSNEMEAVLEQKKNGLFRAAERCQAIRDLRDDL